MKKAVALRHVGFEDLDALEPILRTHGYEVVYCDVPIANNLSEMVHLADILIVLGGPIGVYQNDIFPFLDEEIKLIKEHINSGKPTLGICLGAQLIAKALGSNVYPGTSGKELGWGNLNINSIAKDSIISNLAHVKVLHWHGDTFDLPQGATLLASTDMYENQAYSYSNNVLAFQFHIEVSSKGLERWYVGHISELATLPLMNINELREESSLLSPTLTIHLSKIIESFLNLQNRIYK